MSDIYYAATAVGANNGTSCAAAYAYNDATNGLNTSGVWVAGNTLHICGTITFSANANAITSAGSGSSGNPIIIKFETGAVLSAPAWNDSDGGVVITHNYVTIDGGLNDGLPNGIIESTANGTQGNTACLNGSCSVQYNSSVIQMSGTYNICQNLNVTHTYMHTTYTAPAVTHISETGSTVAVVFASNLSAAFITAATSTNGGISTIGFSNSGYNSQYQGQPYTIVGTPSGNTLSFTYSGIATGLPTLTDGSGFVATTDGVSSGNSISISGSYSQVLNCVVDNLYTGISVSNQEETVTPGCVVAHNKVIACNHGIDIVGGWGGTLVSPLVHDNEITDTIGTWDDLNFNYHHDPCFLFCGQGAYPNATGVTGLQFYNNYIHGLFCNDPWNTTFTSQWFFVQANAAPTYYTDMYIFNNVFEADIGSNNVNQPNDGYIGGFDSAQPTAAITATSLTTNTALFTASGGIPICVGYSPTPAITQVAESGSAVTITFNASLNSNFCTEALAEGIQVKSVSNTGYNTAKGTVSSCSGTALVYTYAGIPTSLPTLTDGTGSLYTLNYGVGILMTVTGTTNGGGIFNVVSAVVTSNAGDGTSFTVELTNANVTSAVETGTVFPANGSFLNSVIANNTIIDNGQGGTALNFSDTTGSTIIKNNLFVTTSGPNLGKSQSPWPTTSNIDHNVYCGAGTENDFWIPGGNVNSFAGWQSYDFDLNGKWNASESSADLNGGNAPSVLSLAYLAGANLTALGITALTLDAAGNARPSSGAWTAGALNAAVAPAITTKSSGRLVF